MKILVISATYMIAYNQKKWLELLRLQPDVRLKILTPQKLPTKFGANSRQRHVGLNREIIPELRSYLNFSHMSYVLDPLKFIKILTSFRPDHIHIEEDPYSAIGVESLLLARFFSPQSKISFFLWDNLDRKPRGLKGLFKLLMNKIGLKRAELVVCGNRDCQRLLHESKGYRGRSVVLPQLGLASDEYVGGVNNALRAQLGVNPSTILIGFAGRLIPEKGIATLLEAVSRMIEQDWKLLLLGSGPMEEEIRARWYPQLSERLIMVAGVPHEDVPRYLRALDIFVLPSVSTPTWIEQFGIVLAQAMLAGIPCIGSSSGAIPEVIGPGGIVFEEGKTDMFVEKLSLLISSASERERIGLLAREYAFSHYTNEAVACAYWHAFVGSPLNDLAQIIR